MPKLRESATAQAERIARLAYRIARGEVITRAVVERDFGVSRPTAKRDMALLARVLRGEKALPCGYQRARVIGAGRTTTLIPLMSAAD